MSNEAKSNLLTFKTRNLGKQYKNGYWGIKNLNFSFENGELVALVGSNGAGKTTTLQLLSRVIHSTTGEIEILLNGQPLLPGLVGWSSQRDSVDWSLTVYENVLFGAKLAGLNRVEAHQATKRMLELVELGNEGHKPPDTLSGGQVRRMQVARALVHDPPVILLDEPNSGLDPIGTELLFGYLKKRVQEGAIVIVSSHDLHVLDNYCTHVVHISKGVLLFSESRSKYIANYENRVRLRIDYFGELKEKTVNKIRQLSEGIFSMSPLDLAVKQTSLSEIESNIEESEVQILSIKKEKLGLRDIYMVIEGIGKR
ncbi:ABC transporter ATP-binding protein [Lederbergia ruris]|uniref:ABC transporter ATP-binding protein n=1 Tax=Lederbergia ruris TaxID=217495 RepID=UPI00399FE5F1